MEALDLQLRDEPRVAAQRVLAKLIARAIADGVRPNTNEPLPVRPRLRVVHASR
jgi:hypothetical protein